MNSELEQLRQKLGRVEDEMLQWRNRFIELDGRLSHMMVALQSMTENLAAAATKSHFTMA